ncbi:MAG: tol-pal system YbgF family protein, partial [Muribaculaceae bacterium]
QNVTLQDSLLRLSRMTPEEQLAIVNKIIEELKKKEKEEKEAAEQEERLAQANSMGSDNSNSNLNSPTQFNINNDKSWYFYNNATKDAGKTQFQKIWGNRKLEDNWRRRNKSTFAISSDEGNEPGDQQALNSDSISSEGSDSEASKHADDPHYAEYYLKQIPKTEEEISNSHNIIQEGLYNMGIILKDKLEDFPSAVSEFGTLLSRYPDNVYRLDTYYNLYLLYMRQGDTANAEVYRQLILSDFAESNYGKAMQDANYIDNLRAMLTVQEDAYAQAYDAYLNNRNDEVHSALARMQTDFPLSKLMPKFMFIDALAYVTENNEEQFKTSLKTLLEQYPETDISPTASAMLKQLNAGRSIKSTSSNTRGLLWATRLSTDSATFANDSNLTPFTHNADKPHIFLLAYPTDSVSANDVLYKVAYHNFTTFVVKDFDLEQMTFGQIGLLAVKGFENYDELVHYRTIFEESELLQSLPKSVRMVLISEDNFNILIREGRSLEEYFIYQESLNTEKVESKVP